MNPLILIVLDGWGINKRKKGNAVALAETPVINELIKKYPNTKLKACCEAVGLPPRALGGSEVGHLHLGAGRIIEQDLTRINKSIQDGSFFRNKALLKAMNNVKKNNSSLHVLGLLSDAGIHSHINHFLAVLKLAKKNKINIYVHAFLDGRDTPPKSAGKYIRMLETEINRLGVGKIVSLCGRYYSMDRDNRWDREHKAYDLLVNGIGRKANNAMQGLKLAYSKGETDEFVKPTLILDKGKEHLIKDHDSVIFINFRSDRSRELTRAFVQGKFGKFRREKLLKLYFVTLTQYDKKIKTFVAFKPLKIKNTLPEILDKNNLKQLRIAETEKYAHVTYFFNAGREHPFPSENRILIPSPKIPTYDMKPEMSAIKITNKLLPEIKKHDFILVNFANPDMVGHTGNLKAAIKAIETVDSCVGKIVKEAEKQNMTAVIVADHGNAEQMIDYKTGDKLTSHTFNKVPFIVLKNGIKLKTDKEYGLSNVAPTVLDLIDLKKPKEMTAESLIKISL